MVEALATSVFSTNITLLRRTNLSETNCPTDVSDSSGLTRNSGKRTARPNSLSQQGIILKILKQLIRFQELSANSRQRSAAQCKTETNCPTQVIDVEAFIQNFGKRTARPNSLSRQEIILKILKQLTRFEEPSMIARHRLAKAETNWHTDLCEPKGLNPNLGKRTGTPKSMKIMGIILKTPKIFIRSHQQVDGTVVLHGAPGLLTDPKACNRSIFSVLDPFFGLKIAGFEGVEPKPPKRNVFS
jgi:hypothetical protein